MRSVSVSLFCGCWTLLVVCGQEGTTELPPSISFSEASSLIAEPITVEVSCSEIAATLRDTIDGVAPILKTGLVYDGPITLSKSTTLRVLATFDDQIVSQDSAAYLLADDDLLGFGSNLPLIVIDSFDFNIDNHARGNSQSEKRPVFALFLDIDDTSGRSKIRSAANFAGRAGMRVRGQTSTMFPKKQYSFEVWDETNNYPSTSLLGFPKESDWVQHAPFSDKTLMCNVLAYLLFREMGHYAAGCKYVELFYNADDGTVGIDDYRGIYILMEKIKLDKNRLAISKLDETMVEAPEITGGYIFKKDKGT